MGSDPFLESDAVKLAVMSGADATDPASFLEALTAIIENDDYRTILRSLSAQGLTIGKLLDLAQPAFQAEADAEMAHPRHEATTLRSPEARSAAVRLAAHGFSDGQIAQLLGVADTNVRRYLDNRRVKASEADIIQMHAEGKTLMEIMSATGLGRNGLEAVLQRLDLQPHLDKKRVTAQTKERIITLRNAGRSYPEIRDETKATTTQITSVLRRAAARGQLRNYGKAAA